jgi:protein O-mannosyl-transferase
MSKRKQPSRRPATPQPVESKPATSPARLFLGIAFIVGVIFLVYWPSIHGDFVMDDDMLLTDNTLIKSPDGLHLIWFSTQPIDYWPITNSSFWIEWRLWGMNPTGYHVINIVLHIINCLLIWLVLTRLAIPGAFLAAVLVAIHSVNVESVAWISQQKNLLSLMFFLLSIGCFLKSEGLTNRWYGLSLLTFVLAMLSKGSVAVLPILLLLIIWWQSGKVTTRNLWQMAPFFAVAIALTAVNISFQTHGTENVIRSVTFAQRLAGAGGVIWFYLYKTFVPLNLSFVYPQWTIDVANPLWWLPLIGVLVVTVILWAQRPVPIGRTILFTWIFFCVALLPVLGFVDVGFMKYSLVADHYLYLAIIPIMALVAAAISRLLNAASQLLRSSTAVATIALISVMAWLCWTQSQLYAGPIKLYEATLLRNPDSSLVHANLSVDLINAGRIDDAVTHAQKALQITPDYGRAHLALGVGLTKLGKLDDAIVQYQQALENEPNLAEACNDLGTIYGMKGDLQKALEYTQRAVELKPYSFESQNDFGLALLSLQRYQEAIDHFQQAISLQPSSPDPFMGLLVAWSKLGRLDEGSTVARTGLVLAKSAGREDLANKFEQWLNENSANLANPPTQNP